MKKLLKKAMKGIDYTIMFALRVLPIDDTCIVLHSRPDFSDNAWAFYKYLKDNGLDKVHEIVWMVEDPHKFSKAEKGIKFVYGSLSGVHPLRDYYLSRAKFIIYTHHAPIKIWRKGQYLIHTTHSASQLKAAKGAGNENGGRAIDPSYRLRCGRDGLERSIIATGLSMDKYLVIGMPRTDLLFEHRDCLSQLLDGRRFKHSIMALETFKQGIRWHDADVGKSFGLNILRSREELAALNAFLSRSDAVLLIKPHRAQDLSYIEQSSLSNIVFVTDEILNKNKIQLYQLLENIDILLTDYSSVFYEYLLLDRPIGFLIGDMDEYKRGFIIDNPLDEMTGRKIQTEKELEEFLEFTFSGGDEYKSQRAELIKRVFKYPDGESCRRLYEFMKSKGLK